jgi:type I restriction enzyme, S subunit
MSKFPLYKIGEVCAVGDGAHAKVDRVSSGVMYLTSKNIGVGFLKLDNVDYISNADYERLFSSKSSAVRRPQSGDVLIGIIGTFGNAYRYKPNDYFGISSSIGLMRPNSELLDSDYLYYVVTSDYFRATHAAYNAGSVQGYTNIPTIKQLSIPLPPLEEQRAIANILGSLDDKIEANRRMNETLEATARAIFKSWFVDFDPVHYKARGETPPGVDAETAALFPDSFGDSELGPIPSGWRVIPIGDAVKAVGGSTPSTSETRYWDDGTINWATPKDLSKLSSPVLLDTERRITEEGLKQISSGLLPQGTVLLSSRAPVGYLTVAEIPVAINQGFIAMICDNMLPALYVLYWTENNLDVIKSRASGTTFQEISKANFRPIPALVPDKEILQVYIELVEPIYRTIVCNLEETRTLTETRDALLPKLVSGEVHINVDGDLSSGL